MLTLFNLAKKSYAYTDALNKAVGATLMQEDKNGNKHPVAYISRKLSPAERNYDIHDKELYAIVDAFKAWRPYLSGANHKITVYSDHKNLTSFITTK